MCCGWLLNTDSSMMCNNKVCLCNIHRKGGRVEGRRLSSCRTDGHCLTIPFRTPSSRVSWPIARYLPAAPLACCVVLLLLASVHLNLESRPQYTDPVHTLQKMKEDQARKWQKLTDTREKWGRIILRKRRQQGKHSSKPSNQIKSEIPTVSYNRPIPCRSGYGYTRGVLRQVRQQLINVGVRARTQNIW